MKSFRNDCFGLLAFATVLPALRALEKQPASVYHARRVALAAKLHGGVAVLFAAEEPLLDFTPYRQDEDFYYLTGWTEPGAALMVVGEPAGAEPRTATRRFCFCRRATCAWKSTPAPSWMRLRRVWRRRRASTPCEQMTELPAALNALIDQDRRLACNLWTQPDAPQAKALVDFTAATLGMDARAATHDVTRLTAAIAHGERRGRD